MLGDQKSRGAGRYWRLWLKLIARLALGGLTVPIIACATAAVGNQVAPQLPDPNHDLFGEPLNSELTAAETPEIGRPAAFIAERVVSLTEAALPDTLEASIRPVASPGLPPASQAPELMTRLKEAEPPLELIEAPVPEKLEASQAPAVPAVEETFELAELPVYQPAVPSTAEDSLELDKLPPPSPLLAASTDEAPPPVTVLVEAPAVSPSNQPAVSTPTSPPTVPTAPITPTTTAPTVTAPTAVTTTIEPPTVKVPAIDQPVVIGSEPASGAQLPSLPARTIPLVEEEAPIFSRTVRLTAGQILEVPFRGTGWVFLGEQSAQKGLSYDSRSIDEAGLSFVFRAESAGNYILKFYRQDFIENYIVNDFVRVIVEAATISAQVGGYRLPLDQSRVIAEPRWPPAPSSQTVSTASKAAAISSSDTAQSTAAQVAAAQASAAQSVAAEVSVSEAATVLQPAAAESVVSPAAVQPAAIPSPPAGTVVEPTAMAASQLSSPADNLDAAAPPQAYFTLAQAEADAGRIATALRVLDRFQERFPAGSDEAWWLYGRYLEANAPTKDIKAALAYYRRLITDYPHSPRYDEALKRITYLERFYLDIR